jgi:hypothetical protein
MTETQQKMFDAASASITAHLTIYGYTVHKAQSRIIITDGRGNKLILRAVN